MTEIQENKPRTPEQALEATLVKMEKQFIESLPKNIDVKKFIRTVINAAIKTPKLLECTRRSLLLAILQAAQLGLEPDGLLGQAYLIPYKTRDGYMAQLQIGYRGYIILALQSGCISFITSEAVYENDDYDFDFFGTPRFRPLLKGDRGELLGYVALARYKDNNSQFSFMNIKDIYNIRDKSSAYRYAKQKGGSDTPWMTDFEEMAKKTVLKRLQKYLPLSVQKAFRIEDNNENDYVTQTHQTNTFDFDESNTVIIDDSPIN